MKTPHNQTTNTTEIIDITEHFGTLYHPKSALVFYQTENPNSDTYVEYFDMDKNGSPINAHPLTVREAQRLSTSLNIQNKKDQQFLKPNGIISSHVLYLDHYENGKVIWVTKAQERELFFVNHLNIPNGMASIPPLLWSADRLGLKLFALKSNQRPNKNTLLFHAPFFNVYENGNVCMGTVDVAIKNSASLEEFINHWQQYFFRSYFSHLMDGHNPINGNCVNLWKNLIETKERFPKEVLIANHKTLKNLI